MNKKNLASILCALIWIFTCLLADHAYHITRDQPPLISTAYTVAIVAGAFLIGLLGNTKHKK